MRKKIGLFFIFLFICSLTAQETTVPAEGEIVLKTIEPYTYVAVEMKGSYDQHEQAFGTLYEQGAIQGLALEDYPMGLYYNNPMDTPVDSLIWEVGTRISGVDSVKAPIVLKTFPFTQVVTMEYSGTFGEEMAASYGKIYQWIVQNGYQLAGPMQEFFISMPEADENGEWVGQVEIVVPVSKPE
jgi:effector-binding domain-containing protein